ncbi:group II intron reverse transcriptase/maturase [Thauera humireducens]|uniref:Group II intron reverse transcriptase/maturase n=1 Tax=Thauera humireducens TaxID=1134435 RepID=A0A127K850_9RHOO|nr:group II intron reverse transcriptase/maturase [Thauera humireducens]AMO38145.1 group II intron reverse transcriptase/maturase [Thauera humireducens]
MDASQHDCDVAFAAWRSWHEIHWVKACKVVAGLQKRIAKAVQAGEWRKVRTLQRLLTNSSSAKALAVRRVTENRGRKTPGVDKQTWGTPEDKWRAVAELGNKKYKPLPLRRINIPKASGGTRPLGIPTMRDRAMQALHLLALDPVAETIGDHNSYGFRRERSTADAIEQVRNVLGRGNSAKWVLEGDIKGCFDNISHDWLIANVCMDKGILRKWLKAGFIETGQLFPTKAGTPQGGIISPVLANIALDGLERELESLPFTRRDRQAAKINLVRYADDFVITGSSRELLERTVKPLVEKFLASRGLALSETKTKITHVTEGFDFLGWNVRFYNGMLVTQPSKKNIKAFLSKIRGLLHERKAAHQIDVIDALSPVIRGWANYHRSQMSSQAFAKCDHRIWEALWRWACRRHPNKGKRWIKLRYFKCLKGRDWRFAVMDKQLPNLCDYRKRPHTKVKGEANPYDPRYDEYFSKRLSRKMEKTLEGRHKLRWLWGWQSGICPICDQRITQETGWHLHHIVKRSNRGTDKLTNLVLLHPNCHMQHHVLEKLYGPAGVSCFK